VIVWDRISSEEAVLLMASYLNPPTNSAIPKTQLAEQYRLAPPIEPRPYPADPLPATTDEKKSGSWVFGDKNAATHLIRNSLAGGDQQKREELLSVHGDVARWLRDDISVQ
jgi:pyruvate dehydrogenase phosphatase